MERSEYIKSLGGSEDLVEKIDFLETLAIKICPEKIETFFISEYKNDEGKRIIDNAWFFSPKYVLESKKIMVKDINIDVMCIDEYIDKYDINSINYDFKKATEESVLTITAYMGMAVAILKATGFNCDILWGIT